MSRLASVIIIAAALVIFMHTGCATLPTDFDRTESQALTDTDNTFIGKLLADEEVAKLEACVRDAFLEARNRKST